MPAVYEISDIDIADTERVLLPPQCTFDAERRSFIRSLETLDLKAVPGSGKTTALLAKLILLDRHLPFKDGSGLLVISHTNAAVNEIKQKIGSLCDHLFGYPNFVGTIQSFVDEFLARPFLANFAKTQPLRIDNELYAESIEFFRYPVLRTFARADQRIIGRYLKNTERIPLADFRFNLVDGIARPVKEINGAPLPIRDLHNWTLSETEFGTIENYLIKLKKEVMSHGILCFDDAYFLGQAYLQNIPRVRAVLQHRFAFVFVDEMQDMESHQHDLLESIFWDEGASVCKYQRIGDRNQAIFNNDVSLDLTWQAREGSLEFNGSQRLSPHIAHVVEPFALEQIRLVGLGKNPDGTDINIKPQILVFDDESILSVLPAFIGLIKKFRGLGLIPPSVPQTYKAIGWNAKEAEKSIRIPNYFPKFSRDKHQLTIDSDTLEGYLNLVPLSSEPLRPISRRLVSAFTKITRLEEIRADSQRYFSSAKLLEKLALERPVEYSDFQLNIYRWAIGIVRSDRHSILEEIRAYIPSFLALFGRTVSQSLFFVESSEADFVRIDDEEETEGAKAGNVFSFDGINVEVSTVHATKGQTHTATLYLETDFKGDLKSQD